MTSTSDRVKWTTLEKQLIRTNGKQFTPAYYQLTITYQNPFGFVDSKHSSLYDAIKTYQDFKREITYVNISSYDRNDDCFPNEIFVWDHMFPNRHVNCYHADFKSLVPSPQPLVSNTQ